MSSGGQFFMSPDTQPMAQLVCHGPGRLIRHIQFALQKLGRNPALIAAHQISGKKPLGQIGSRPVKHRSSGRRFLPMAARTFIYPWARLQPPRLTSAAPGTGEPARPAKPGQMFARVRFLARVRSGHGLIPSPGWSRSWLNSARNRFVSRAPAEGICAAASGPRSATMKAYSGPPMTLGNAAAAHVRLIVWCRDCGHRVEPAPAFLS